MTENGVLLDSVDLWLRVIYRNDKFFCVFFSDDCSDLLKFWQVGQHMDLAIYLLVNCLDELSCEVSSRLENYVWVLQKAVFRQGALVLLGHNAYLLQ